MGDELFLIEKRGLYYRPESRGYTGLKREAGRYLFDDAAQIVGPNGPDGPQDGMVIWRESEAPEYSQSCAWDVRMKDEAYRQGKAEAAAEIDSLKAQLQDAETPAFVMAARRVGKTAALEAMRNEARREGAVAMREAIPNPADITLPYNEWSVAQCGAAAVALQRYFDEVRAIEPEQVVKK